MPRATGARPWTASASGSPSSGSDWPRPTGPPSWTPTPPPGTELRHRMPPARRVVLRELLRPAGSTVTAGRVARRRAAAHWGTPRDLDRRHCSRRRLGRQLHRARARRARPRRPAARRPPPRPRWRCARLVATAGMGFRTDATGGWSTPPGAPTRRCGPSAPCAAASCGSPRRSPRSAPRPSASPPRVLDAVAPLPRRLEDGRLVGGHHPVARPRDPLGLPLSTTAEAAAAYNAGLERVMRLQSGGEELLREAAALDPDFALAHAALAMLGHEAGADDRRRGARSSRPRAAVRSGVTTASAAWSTSSAAGSRTRAGRGRGADGPHRAATRATSSPSPPPCPTIAFSGVTDVQQEAWDLVEGLAPAYGDHWWYISLLAFTRQDQGRFEEAGLLAESALSCEPSSGHAVHAQTHVLYETGKHEAGRVWLDHWVTRERALGLPPGPLLLARGAARAGARRHRGGAPALLLPARAPGRHRGARADRLRVAAVALADHHVRLGPRLGRLGLRGRELPRRRSKAVLEAADADAGRPARDPVRGPACRARARGGRRPLAAGRPARALSLSQRRARREPSCRPCATPCSPPVEQDWRRLRRSSSEVHARCSSGSAARPPSARSSRRRCSSAWSPAGRREPALDLLDARLSAVPPRWTRAAEARWRQVPASRCPEVFARDRHVEPS